MVFQSWLQWKLICTSICVLFQCCGFVDAFRWSFSVLAIWSCGLLTYAIGWDQIHVCKFWFWNRVSGVHLQTRVCNTVLNAIPGIGVEGKNKLFLVSFGSTLGIPIWICSWRCAEPLRLSLTGTTVTKWMVFFLQVMQVCNFEFVFGNLREESLVVLFFQRGTNECFWRSSVDRWGTWRSSDFHNWSPDLPNWPMWWPHLRQSWVLREQQLEFRLCPNNFLSKSPKFLRSLLVWASKGVVSPQSTGKMFLMFFHPIRRRLRQNFKSSSLRELLFNLGTPNKLEADSNHLHSKHNQLRKPGLGLLIGQTRAELMGATTPFSVPRSGCQVCLSANTRSGRQEPKRHLGFWTILQTWPVGQVLANAFPFEILAAIKEKNEVSWDRQNVRRPSDKVHQTSFNTEVCVWESPKSFFDHQELWGVQAKIQVQWVWGPSTSGFGVWDQVPRWTVVFQTAVDWEHLRWKHYSWKCATSSVWAFQVWSSHSDGGPDSQYAWLGDPWRRQGTDFAEGSSSTVSAVGCLEPTHWILWWLLSFGSFGTSLWGPATSLEWAEQANIPIWGRRQRQRQEGKQRKRWERKVWKGQEWWQQQGERQRPNRDSNLFQMRPTWPSSQQMSSPWWKEKGFRRKPKGQRYWQEFLKGEEQRWEERRRQGEESNWDGGLRGHRQWAQCWTIRRWLVRIWVCRPGWWSS